ncbi:MAG: SMP-30/gluconolactonase/LRE family protein [Alphaproteobacteria bacterium]|nr:SMP-30/gluconolactonase/LRE family protein [Alphaproteobacteria bacterium]
MQFQLVASGLQFPEGPIIMADGSIVLVEIKRRTLSRVTPGGRRETIAELGGGPNGAAVGPDGCIYVCNNGGMSFVTRPDGSTAPHGVPDDYKTGSIQRVNLRTGKFEVVYDSCDGVRLNGPNDIVFDAHGGFWFTDLGKVRADKIDQGALYYARADGSKIVRAPVPLITPNGVGLSPDGKIVWVSETYTSRVWGYEIASPGQIAMQSDIWTPGRVLGPLRGYQLLDSLAVEAGGKVCVATIVNGGITAFDPDGSIEHVPSPDPLTTNICFGGADMCDAWITCSGRGELYRVRWPRPGLKLNYNG